MTQDSSIPNILLKLGQLMGTTLTNNRLDIPKAFGKGYCAGYVFNEHVRLLISDYELKEDFLIEQPKELASGKLLFFKFQNIFPKATYKSFQTPSVLIATRRIAKGESFSIHSNSETINIEVDLSYLSNLLSLTDRTPLIESLLGNTVPLFFEQLMYPALLKVVEEILTSVENNTFRLFFLRVKAEELICRLLMELDKREEKQFYPLRKGDINLVYRIRDQIISNLETPPIIADLANRVAMSPSKLKRLFRQIFGNSIFNYYQQFRMKEAARLLKTENLSVSAVGYQLGFTNLSHFSKLFESHIGMKPKQYSRT